ncbi:hypothetical protein E4U19_004709 [Claviceps sp. Clav32 group G5]|nr:hypothetical protein E4U19_004709 [Claviceps sp. Clav32 group G5]
MQPTEYPRLFFCIEPLPIASRMSTLNLYYPSIMKAATALEVSYHRVYGRSKGRRPVSHNGGQRAILTPAEDRELLIWAHRQVMCGHHIQIRRLRLQVNEILRASGRNKKVTRRWDRRYMSRHTHIFHMKKTSTQEARRKAVEDRAIITSCFQAWRTYLYQHKPVANFQRLANNQSLMNDQRLTRRMPF